MSLVFFNTLTRNKEVFIPINTGEVKLYTCGPTVYDYAHIGNFRTYVFEDVLRRWLKISGYKVTQAMNLTDVDDKTIRGARQKNVTLSEYTHDYINFFYEDFLRLGNDSPEEFPRATNHIPEMVEIIESLLKKGIAYKGEDGSIYFNVAKFPSYGELAHIEVGELKAGARVSHDEYDKAQASDFALWKAWDPDDGNVFWETSLGKGRPGWHIECSAMSMKYLGRHFDIHTGGVDNIFPHHQNEIAQSEAYTGEKFVNYWLHAEHLIVDGRKMSKSLGNFYTVRDVVKKGFSYLALRYFYISSHYRNKLNFTFDALQGASSAVGRIGDFARRLRETAPPAGAGAEAENAPANARKEFDEAMNDDLNTPRALAAIHELINVLNPILERRALTQSLKDSAAGFLLHADRLLAIELDQILKGNAPEIDPPIEVNLAQLEGRADLPASITIVSAKQVDELLQKRESLRKEKRFKDADFLRDALMAKGIVLEDTPSGTRWKVTR